LSALHLLDSIAERRRTTYTASDGRQRRLARPVISVGNLSLGGTGKTPVVSWIARELVAAGERPAILSRGYARPSSREGVVVVSDGERVLAGFDVSGDEPLMLARRLPGCAVLVSPDRYLAGTLAERQLGCTVHVLDDGFQHLRLARALDVVVIRPEDLRDRVIPFGRLREPASALAHADAIVVGEEHEMAVVHGLRAPVPVFAMHRALGDPRAIDPWGGAVELNGRHVAAFAGIGRPEQFFQDVRAAGWDVVATFPFADHRRYTPRVIARLCGEAVESGATLLLTTEKDAVRLEGIPASLPIAFVPLAVGFNDAQGLRMLLSGVL
jgi:tetraacyldisaccharide 4'-kinase